MQDFNQLDRTLFLIFVCTLNLVWWQSQSLANIIPFIANDQPSRSGQWYLRTVSSALTIRKFFDIFLHFCKFRHSSWSVSKNFLSLIPPYSDTGGSLEKQVPVKSLFPIFQILLKPLWLQWELHLPTPEGTKLVLHRFCTTVHFDHQFTDHHQHKISPHQRQLLLPFNQRNQLLFWIFVWMV